MSAWRRCARRSITFPIPPGLRTTHLAPGLQRGVARACGQRLVFRIALAFAGEAAQVARSHEHHVDPRHGRDLVGDLVRLQGNGDYDGMRAFFDRYARLDDQARAVLATTTHIPTDIRPIYPDHI